jgi:hypothetical protein
LYVISDFRWFTRKELDDIITETPDEASWP